MLNRRKAMIGWLVYTAGKPLAKRALKQRAKGAKSAVPGTAAAKGGAPKGAILAAVGAVVGGLLFWRSRKSDDDGGPDGGSGAGGSDAGSGESEGGAS